ncbi:MULTISPECIES: hypothetical protein [unclassified Wolbachia]|nr:hypothetical protein [Wolbachia endosymbiont of Erebia cassioides]
MEANMQPQESTKEEIKKYEDITGFCRIYKLWYKKIVKLGLWEL